VVLIIIIIIIIIIIAIATGRPRLHSHQSDSPQYIKTLDSTAVGLHDLLRDSFTFFTTESRRIGPEMLLWIEFVFVFIDHVTTFQRDYYVLYYICP
jgi:hypothetical protein